MNETWPPTPPDAIPFKRAFMHMKENVRFELRQRDTSPEDRNLAQYMRTSNIGTGLVAATEGPYEGQMVVSFDTVTDRTIRPKLLRIFRSSTEGEGIFLVPTDVTHAAANGVTKREAAVLAHEWVGGFYEQYEMARAGGISKRMLRDISPERYEEQLRLIYDQIRERSLSVLRAGE